jgi:type II secretory pathway component PulF
MPAEPLSLSDQVALFHNCAQFLKAGLPIGVALTHAAEGASAPLAAVVRAMGGLTSADGCSIHEAFSRALPSPDPLQLALIEQGEAIGKLPETFAQLEQMACTRLERRSRLQRELIYPVGLVVAAILLSPVTTLVMSGLPAYLAAVSWRLAVPGGLLWILHRWVRASWADPGQRESWQRLLFHLPLFGRALKADALARFAGALASLLGSGLAVDRSLELAARSSGYTELERRIGSAVAALKKGATLTQALAVVKDLLGASLLAIVHTGEVSGTLDTSLSSGAKVLQTEADSTMEAALKALGPAITFVVMLGLGVYVILFYMDYFQQLQDASK